MCVKWDLLHPQKKLLNCFGKKHLLCERSLPIFRRSFLICGKAAPQLYVQKSVPNDGFLRHVSHVFNPIAEDFYLLLPLYTYCTLTKEHPWAEQFTSLPKRRVGTLSSVTMKEQHPCHVYSDSMPLNQIIGQTITYNGAASGFEVKSRWHTTLWAAPCHGEHHVARGAHCISYIRPPKTP